MKRPEGVTVIAVLHILNAVMFGLFGLAILLIPVPVVWFNVTDATGRFWALFALGPAAAFIIAAGGLTLLAGVGLLRLQDGARWLTVALALLALPAFPVGSLIGALTLAYLLQPTTGQAFAHAPQPQPATIKR